MSALQVLTAAPQASTLYVGPWSLWICNSYPPYTILFTVISSILLHWKCSIPTLLIWISKFDKNVEVNRIHLPFLVPIFCLKIQELWFNDSLVTKELWQSAFWVLALRMSHEISQITFTTIPWDRYYHYRHLTDEENEGQWGHTDTKRKARTWAKAFGHQKSCS